MSKETETVAIEKITPQMAREILDKHEKAITDGVIRQRPLNDGSVERYANDMVHDNWLVNNQGIGFDTDDNLVDGRHRLWSIVRSNKTVRMVVLRGMQDVSSNGVLVRPVNTVDLGRPRSVGNQFSIDGVKHANAVTAALRVIGLQISKYRSMKLSVPTAKGIYKLYGKHINRVHDAFGNDCRFFGGFLVGPLAMYAHVNDEKAVQFSESYRSGAGLPEGHPILALKTYFRTHPGHGSDSVIRRSNATALALFHFNNNGAVSTIRNSEIGSDWLVDEQKNTGRKVRDILGVQDME